MVYKMHGQSSIELLDYKNGMQPTHLQILRSCKKIMTVNTYIYWDSLWHKCPPHLTRTLTPGQTQQAWCLNSHNYHTHWAQHLAHHLPKQYMVIGISYDMLIFMNNFLVDVVMYNMLGQSNIQVYQRLGCCLCWWRTSWRLSWCIRCMGKVILMCSAIWMNGSGILAPLRLSPPLDPPEL